MWTYTLILYFKDTSSIRIPGFRSKQDANEVGNKIHIYNPRIQSWDVDMVTEK